MLVHRGKIEKAAICCSDRIKQKRIHLCKQKAIELMGKRRYRLFSKYFTPLSFEEAMIKAWDDYDICFLYLKQIQKTKDFLALLYAVETEYIDLTSEEAAFIGKWL